MARRYRRKSGSMAEAYMSLSVLLGTVVFTYTQNLTYAITAFVGGIAIIVAIIMYLKNKERQRLLQSGISDVDKMSGTQFEVFLKVHFQKQGYRVELTPTTGDYGADLVLSKNGERIVVQAKRYNNSVGIKAVQEVVSSINYYKANKGIVITNSRFTKNAEALAKANNIELWDRKNLINTMVQAGGRELVEEIQSTDICPLCLGNLILKHGKNGSFYGCSNYPSCKFTRRA
jgi:restriction system protein